MSVTLGSYFVRERASGTVRLWRTPAAVGAAVLVVAAVTAICRWAAWARIADVAMLYLLGVVTVAMSFGYVASLVATVLSVAGLDFFFTEPDLSFYVTDKHHLVTFVIMLFVAVVISNLMERFRRTAAIEAQAQEVKLEMHKELLRNALLSSVSHDLRTPLTVLMGAASALLGDDGMLRPERRREYLETISQEASRLNRLVRNLLNMTSLESGTLRARTEWQPLEEVVGVALRRLDEQLQGRPVRVEIAPDAWAATFDAVLIEQVFVNLVENAARYTPPGTAIAIRTAPVGAGVEVEVADDGPGVPPGEEEHVFEKFRRVGPDVQGGMGLGLTICRGIIEAHGGRIWCENRPGGGASFRFRLPQSSPAVPFHVLPEEVEA
jgi:two-component system sensor histidine kinase KdpD